MENMCNGKGQAKILTIVSLILLVCAFLFVIYATVQVADAMNKTYIDQTETESEYTDTETDTEITTPIPVSAGIYEYEDMYYIFCVVTSCNEETFTAQLPNGEYESFYMIEDYPIDDNGNPYFESVVFKVLKEFYADYDAWIVMDVN